MPNNLAYAAIICWPLFSIYFFYRFKLLLAVLLSAFIATLILPAAFGINLPGIPKIDREAIMVLTLIFGTCAIKKQSEIFVVESRLLFVLLSLYVIVPLFSVPTNLELTRAGAEYIQGYDLYSAVSDCFKRLLIAAMFVLGLNTVRTLEDQVLLFKALAVSGAIYCLPSLLEVRLSPFIHQTVYGFFPSSFAQQVRYGGFRPTVFIGHGLVLATFLSVATSAAFGLMITSDRKERNFWLCAIIVLLFTLIVSKSAGPIIIFILLCVGVLVSRVLWTGKLALFLTLFVCLYPVLMYFDFYIGRWVAEQVEFIDYTRARSLETRLDNESRLFERAMEKPIFGWGGWGRSRVANAISDGYWILQLGQWGWLGLSLFFAIVLYPMTLASKTISRLVSKRSKSLLIVHAWIIGVLFLDQIPNTSMANLWIYWFVLGALGGRCLHISGYTGEVQKMISSSVQYRR